MLALFLIPLVICIIGLFVVDGVEAHYFIPIILLIVVVGMFYAVTTI